MKMQKRIVGLLQEPSTYAGLAALLGGVSLFGLSETMWMSVFSVVMAAAGAYAMVVLDKPHVKNDEEEENKDETL